MEIARDQMNTISTSELLPLGDQDFWMQVCGDSMTGDGILNGDVVWMRPVDVVQDGAIHGIWVGSDRRCGIKRLFREGENLRLRSSNPAYADSLVPVCDVQELAVVKGLVRALDPQNQLVRHVAAEVAPN